MQLYPCVNTQRGCFQMTKDEKLRGELHLMTTTFVSGASFMSHFCVFHHNSQLMNSEFFAPLELMVY